MPATTHTQTNFTAGEISPLLLGRTDLTKYSNGVRLLRNFVPKQHGGISNRNGTVFAAAAKNSGSAYPTVACCNGNRSELDEKAATENNTLEVRLIPFQFSIEETYILEFGHLYIRFYKDDGRIESPPGTPVEVTTTYTGAQLKEIQFTQSADVLYICHPDHSPRTLSRTSDTSWTLSLFLFTDGPYNEVNLDAAKTLTLSSITLGSVTLTATGHTPFLAVHAQTADRRGLVIRLKQGVDDDWGWGYVTAFISTSSVTFQLVNAPSAVTATADWRLGQWNDNDGWPWVPTFHQNRLFFGGRNNLPQTIWGSTSGNFLNFQPSDIDTGVVSEADALQFTINDDQVNAVYWLVSTDKGILVGTSGGEFVCKSSDTNSGISPTNVSIYRQSNRGSKANVRPSQVGNAALFVQRHGRKLREFIYEFDRDSHVSQDLTLISEHITADRLKYIIYMAEPYPILWAIDEQGKLLSMTYERDQEVFAWAQHKIGGSFFDRDAIIDSIAVVPESDFDRLWMVVRRTIDGEVTRYIEYMTDPFETGDSLLFDAIFLDSTLTYNGWNADECNQLMLTIFFDEVGSSSYDESSYGSSSQPEQTWEEDSFGIMEAICHTPFTEDSVGRVYRFNADLGDPDKSLTPIDVEVVEFYNSTTVKVKFLNDVPESLQNYSTIYWALTASTVTGLEHLEGETVGVLIDGAHHADVVVSSGEVDLTFGSEAVEFSSFGGVIHVGLPYVSDVQSLPLALLEIGFDARGRVKSVYKAHVLFNQSVGCLLGQDSETLDQIPFRQGGDPLGQHTPLFTGRKTIAVEGKNEIDTSVFIRQEAPLPVTVLAVTYEVDVNSV